MFARFILIALVALIAWGALARPSDGSRTPRIYVVKPYDTLWAIASAHYGGDPRAAVWNLRARNDLRTNLLRPGQRLVLP